MNFSVIVPLFNKRDTVARAINSALAQTHAPAEIIVVDDGSTDGSQEIVLGFGSKVAFIQQPNAGPAAARNRGACMSSGDFLIFLDADEELEPDCLAEHLACSAENPEAELSIASFRKQYADGSCIEESLAKRVAPDTRRFAYFTGFNPAGTINIVTSGICISRNLFEHIGGFDEKLRCWEITDLLFRSTLGARAVGLHAHISVISHELPENSQFVRTQGVAEFRLRFSLNVAERLGDITEPGRTVMRKQLLGMAYSLWHDGAIDEVRKIYSALVVYLEPQDRASNLYFIQKLPKIVQRALLLVRRIADH